MRILSTSWLLFIGVASAVTHPAQVYVLDPESSPKQTTLDDSVGPEVAKLTLSRRLGFSDFYSLSENGGNYIQVIDQYGGPQQQPFSLGNHHQSRILLAVEGVTSSDDLLPTDKSHLGRFDIKQTPHHEETSHLLNEFITEAERYTTEASSGYSQSKALEKLSIQYGNKAVTRNGRTIVYVTSLMNADKQYGANSVEYQEEMKLIKQAVQDLSDSKDSIVTILFTPLEKFTAKSTDTSGWGAKIQRRSETEAPLTSNLNKAAIQSTPNRNGVSSPLLNTKAIPSRYTTLQDCQSTTKNCTGHGDCRKIFSQMSGDHLIEYFGCKCTPYVNETAAGTRTTYYAGSACQKIDKTVPFWLLAGVTIFLVTVISLGVGLLASMGSEELPSVIGAGVTGPRAK